MKTKYVYTLLGEQIARDNQLPEYRKAGTAASFAYMPLEESPITAKAWLDAGIIEEVKEPVNFLTFTFTSTAANAMTKLFRENNIKYYYGPWCNLMADINKDGHPVNVDYYFIAKDPETDLNLMGIMEQPRTTSQYFKMSPVDLYKKNADDYSKEEALLCDNCPDAHPFADNYTAAVEKAKYYESIGCQDIEILQRINNKFAVVAY